MLVSLPITTPNYKNLFCQTSQNVASYTRVFFCGFTRIWTHTLHHLRGISWSTYYYNPGHQTNVGTNWHIKTSQIIIHYKLHITEAITILYSSPIGQSAKMSSFTLVEIVFMQYCIK